jgi:hypothetical protein
MFHLYLKIASALSNRENNMTPSNELHQLIHSLSKNEKRCFSTNSKKDSDYQRLFNIIEKQKIYDQEEVKKNFSPKNISRQLSVRKSYLFENILQELSTLRINYNYESHLNAQIQYCEVLISKNLIHSAHKRIKRIKNECLNHELFLLALNALQVERKILALKNSQSAPSEFSQLHSAIKQITPIYQNLMDYYALNDRLIHFRNVHFSPRKSSERKFYTVFLQDPLLKKETLALSYSAQIIYNRLIAECLSQLDKQHEAIRYRKRAVELFKHIPSSDEKTVVNYLFLLRDLALDLCLIGQPDEALVIAQDIAAIDKNYVKLHSEMIRVVIFTTRAIVELHAFYFSGRFDEGVKCIESGISKLLKINENHIDSSNKLSLNYLFVQLYFSSGEYRKALRKINSIIQEYETHTGNDVVCFCYIIRLIIHIELKNEPLLKALNRSTISFLQKRKRIFKIEELFLKFSDQLVKTKPKERFHLFQQLKYDLDRVLQSRSEKKVLQFFNFPAWLTSHIEKRPFGEVFRKSIVP